MNHPAALHIILLYFQPPAEGQVSAMSGILGKLPKWKNDSVSTANLAFGITVGRNRFAYATLKPSKAAVGFCSRIIRKHNIIIFLRDPVNTPIERGVGYTISSYIRYTCRSFPLLINNNILGIRREETKRY